LIHAIIFATILYFIYFNSEIERMDNMETVDRFLSSAIVPRATPLVVYSTSDCSDSDIITNTRRAIKQKLYFKAGPVDAPVCRGPFLFEKPETED
jgi:hypothetical protein